MAKRVWALGNATSQPITLSSTEHTDPQDRPTAAPHTVIHTGGKDNNYMLIADCSAKKYYNEHHMTIAGVGGSLTFWDDDSQKGLLYYSTDGTYEGRQQLPGTDAYESCTLLIYERSGGGWGFSVGKWT